MFTDALDIREGEKNGAKVLEIEGKKYSELDELIEMHVYPLTRNVQEVLRCPKYVNMAVGDMSTFDLLFCSFKF